MLELGPDRTDMMVTMGDLFRSEGRYRDALFWYSQALEKKSNLSRQDWYLVFAHAVCNFELGKWAKAEAGMLQALQLNPDEATVLNYLGYSWIDKGVRQKEATEMIRRAVELKPDDGFILDSYGWAYFLTGEFEKAAVHLEKAVKLEPEDVTINEHLGDAYWKLGRRSEARFQWRYALQSNPTDEERPSLEGKLAYGLDVWEKDQKTKDE